MKVWITKYSLSQGIIEEEAESCGEDVPNMIRVLDREFSTFYHGEGREWHRTKESAIKRAEEMRQKKIASLKKQIQKLEKMKFE